MDESDFKRLLELSAAETRAHMDAIASQLRQEIAETRVELRAEINDLRQDGAADRQEIRGHFEALTELLETKIELVAEGVALVSERLEREATDIRAEMREGFEQTHSLIKYSHHELDRRVTVLEERSL
ncbi:MAG TPA: hypothetical protein VE010_03010 [Thermoanaerobaculia bacterium]|nr:hypothetical protein [Thermoanaerobaculia bacterium]